MTKNEEIINLIRQSYDLHVHIGPEIIPRKFLARDLAKKESGKLAGAVLKNHFYPTSPFIFEKGCELFGGLVLNNFVGGLNPEAVYASALLNADKPFVVWFPTTSAKQFLDNSKWEIAPEWVRNKNFSARPAKNISSISVLDANGKITSTAVLVLQAIKKSNAILATGHISWKESEKLIRKAVEIGIKNIIITHPIYQRIAMPIEKQKEMAMLGARIELCYSMYSIDNIPIQEIAAQIKALGAKNCFLSSDVGQQFSPSPSVALKKFALLLLEEGITMDELQTMLVANPRKILTISKGGE